MTSLPRPRASTLITPTTRLRQAVVTAVDVGPPSTVTLNLGGDITDVPGIRYLDGYTPGVGDVAQVLQNDSTFLVIGRAALEMARIVAWQSDLTSDTFTLAGGYETVNGWTLKAGFSLPSWLSFADPVITFNETGIYTVKAKVGLVRGSSSATVSGNFVLYLNGNFTGGAFLASHQFNMPIGGAGPQEVMTETTYLFTATDTIRPGIDSTSLSTSLVSEGSVAWARQLLVTRHG